jgi:acetylornithine deacetylase/succinyl-diaminopimelate desuccinylase-like protein
MFSAPRSYLLTISLGVAALLSGMAGADPRASAASAEPSIDPERYRSNVARLASEEMAGRRVGTAGGRLAVSYMETMFREAGLVAPEALGGYRQNYRHDWHGVTDATNVVGILPGSHPELRREVVVVSAHHDGLGRNRHDGCPEDEEGRRIRYGANDNASGAAALIELAFVLSAQAGQLDRTLVFLSTDGEECGCTGVKNYVLDAPVLPIEQTVYNLNIDQIGEGAWLEEHEIRRRGRERADCEVDGEVFARRGVEAATLVGDNANYHSPEDVVENMDFDEALQVVRRAHALVLDAARSDGD